MDHDQNDIETQDSPANLQKKPLPSTKKQAQSAIKLAKKTNQNSNSITFTEDTLKSTIEQIKHLVKRKTIDSNLTDISPCHSCHSQLQRMYLKQCWDKQCERFFCYRCLNKKYQLNIPDIMSIAHSENWSCLSCQGSCNCRICKDLYLQREGVQMITHERVRRKPGTKKEENEQAPTLKEPAVSSEVVEKAEQPKDDSKEEAKVEEQKAEQEKPTVEQPQPESQDKEKKTEDESIKEQEVQEAKKDLGKAPQQKKYVKKGKKKDGRRGPRALRLQMKIQQALERGENIDEIIQQSENLKKRKMRSRQANKQAEEVQGDKVEKEQSVTYSAKSSVQQQAKNQKKQCHYCQNYFTKKHYYRCSNSGCDLIYCLYCIIEHIKKDFDVNKEKREGWKCYKCTEACTCIECRKMLTEKGSLLKRLLYKQQEERSSNKYLEKQKSKYYQGLFDGNIEYDMFQGNFYDENPTSRKLVLGYQLGADELETIEYDLQVKKENRRSVFDQEEVGDSEEATCDNSANKFLNRKKKFKSGAFGSEKALIDE